MKICGDCGCKEGEIHEFGCDMEECPFCGNQLISCDCVYNFLKLKDDKKYTYKTSYLPIKVYEKGLSDQQKKKWLTILNGKGRRPYIQWPNICIKCGVLWPEMFHVSDEEWEKYIDFRYRKEMICKECYNKIKYLIDNNAK